MITRRDFTAGLFLAAATQSAWAQAPAKQHRIVFVFTAGSAANWRGRPLWRIFFSELHRLGYTESDNLVVEALSVDGALDRYADVAREAVSRSPDVIVAVEALVIALRSATGAIPIVATMGDPLNAGLVTSLARRPGDNLTGISEGGGELWGKRLQILKDAIPSASRIGLLAPPGLRESSLPGLRFLREAGAALGVSLIEIYPSAATLPEIERSFATLAEQRADAVLVGSALTLAVYSQAIVELAERYRLPAMYAAQIFAEAGGLMSYTVDLTDLGRRLADDVHQIFSGVKPGDIPIYQATKFKLVINLKTANALGLTLPRSLLALADEVIE